MPFTTTLSTDIGKVRLLIPDDVEAHGIFTDEQITSLLDLEGQSIKRSAALGLETIARNQAMIQKVMETRDIKTNGAVLAKELRASAADLRKQADDAGDGVASASSHTLQRDTCDTSDGTDCGEYSCCGDPYCDIC